MIRRDDTSAHKFSEVNDLNSTLSKKNVEKESKNEKKKINSLKLCWGDNGLKEVEIFKSLINSKKFIFVH